MGFTPDRTRKPDESGYYELAKFVVTPFMGFSSDRTLKPDESGYYELLNRVTTYRVFLDNTLYTCQQNCDNNCQFSLDVRPAQVR